MQLWRERVRSLGPPCFGMEPFWAAHIIISGNDALTVYLLPKMSNGCPADLPILAIFSLNQSDIDE